MHSRDKRKWFAVHFGKSYFKSNSPAPSMALGLALPLLAVFVLAAVYMLGHEAAGTAFAFAAVGMSVQTDRVIELTREIDRRMSELEAAKAKIQSEGRQSTAEERSWAVKVLGEVNVLTEELNLERQEAETREKLSESRGRATKPSVQSKDEYERKYPGLPPKELRFNSFGEQLSAIIHASQPGGRVDRRLSRAATGMGEDVPTDGGFLVQTDYSSDLLRTVYEKSPIVSRVRHIPIGANANGLKINAINETSRASTVWGGIVMYWLGEGSTKTPSAPKLRQVELKLKKVAGLYYCTDELLEDATALAAVANEGFAEALDVELEDVIINGTGAGQPHGIMASTSLITVDKEGGQDADTIVAENILNMWSRLQARSMESVVWMTSRSTLPQLMQLQIKVGTSGQLLWMPPNGLAGAPYGTLLGRPVLPVENCQKLGDKGDLILADLNQYIMIDKGGPAFASSIHVKFIYDETTFRIVYRCDGQPASVSALTPRDGSSTLSPFVTLAERA